MKKRKLFFIVTTAVLLIVTACSGSFVDPGTQDNLGGNTGGGGGGGGGPQTATYTGTSGGQTYTLKITKGKARYTAQTGDDYVLTAGSKKSAGKVDSVSSGELTLKPSNATDTFTANVSGSSITTLKGTIKWTDGSTDTAPGALTGGGGGSGDNLSLSGQVYTMDVDTTAGSINYVPYTGPDKTLTGGVLGGAGSITNGQMTFSIGVPWYSVVQDILYGEGGHLPHFGLTLKSSQAIPCK